MDKYLIFHFLLLLPEVLLDKIKDRTYSKQKNHVYAWKTVESDII